MDQLYYVAHKQSICQSTNFLNASSNIRSVKSVSTLNFQINEPKNNMTFQKERDAVQLISLWSSRTDDAENSQTCRLSHFSDNNFYIPIQKIQKS